MLRAGKTSQNRIRTRYQSGLVVYANCAAEGDWKIQLDGREYLLPPYGHAACLPGRLLQYSALFDGRRVDYSKGPLYTYMNAGGTPFAFPEMTAAGPCLLRQRGDAVLFTPVPFLKPDTVKGLAASNATPCGPDEKPLAAPIALSGSLPLDGKAFHYLLK
jgi:hypothetical protein